MDGLQMDWLDVWKTLEKFSCSKQNSDLTYSILFKEAKQNSNLTYSILFGQAK